MIRGSLTRKTTSGQQTYLVCASDMIEPRLLEPEAKRSVDCIDATTERAGEGVPRPSIGKSENGPPARAGKTKILPFFFEPGGAVNFVLVLALALADGLPLHGAGSLGSIPRSTAAP